MQNKNYFSCHHDVIRFCQYFSNQSGWLGEVSLHEQCRVDFTKMHPQRAPKSMFSCRGLYCSIFKNTSATYAYPLVNNARKLKRDKRAHACAQGTFSYTPCSRRSLTKKYMFFRKYIRLKKHMFFEKVYMFLKKYICFLKKYVCFLKNIYVF